VTLQLVLVLVAGLLAADAGGVGSSRVVVWGLDGVAWALPALSVAIV
jgi:hypothetical protein